jgi:iron(III) transport system substrate-binding protein
VLKSTKNPQAARAFVAFLLSREGQELALKQGYIPAHPQVALPAGFPGRDEIRLMAFDPAKALADAKANSKRFSDIFGP